MEVLLKATDSEVKELIRLADKAKDQNLRDLLLGAYHKATVERVQGNRKEQGDGKD